MMANTKRTTLMVMVGIALGCGPKHTSDTIVSYGRENNSGTYAYFKEHVLADEDFASSIQTLPGTAAVINAVSKDKRSIGYGGIGYVKGVRALNVKKDAAAPAIEPTLENVTKGAYPISRFLYFYTAGQPTGVVKEFIDWTTSEEGQKICADVGYYPLPKDRWTKSTTASTHEKQTITIKGSDTMVILGQRWAEIYMKEHPEILVQITGGGSGTGIAALIDGSTNICQASRPMKDKEREQVKAKFGKDVAEISVAMDGLAVFVHEENPLREVTLEQLKGIYTGKIKNWRELGWKD